STAGSGWDSSSASRSSRRTAGPSAWPASPDRARRSPSSSRSTGGRLAGSLPAQVFEHQLVDLRAAVLAGLEILPAHPVEERLLGGGVPGGRGRRFQVAQLRQRGLDF